MKIRNQLRNGKNAAFLMRLLVSCFVFSATTFYVQAQPASENKEIPESKPFFVGKNEPIYPADKGVTRQIYGYDDNIMMVKVIFEKGAIGTPHTHIHSQTSYVVSGKFEVTVGDEVKILEEGDGFYAAPNVKHGCVCLEEGVLIDVFSPIRKDFLPK